MSKTQTCLLIFGDVSNTDNSGLSLFHYKLYSEFKSRNSLISLYCLSACDEVKCENNIRIVTLEDKFWFKVYRRLLKLMHKFFSSISIRLYTEKMFDLYFSRSSFYKDCTSVLVPKPSVLRSLKVVKRMGKKVVVIATIAHPLFIREQMKKIEERYNVKDQSNYSLMSQIERITSIFALADTIVPRISSPFIHNSYVKNGISASKIQSIKSSVILNLEVFKPTIKQRKEFVFMTSGFMNLKKGLPLLLEAWKTLKSAGELENAVLVVVGQVDVSTEQVLRILGFIENVEYVGHTNKIHEFYQEADVFIASSISDLGPRTVEEAMACGIPVIASRNCGTAQYIKEGYNGFTYDPFDLNKLKSHMIWFRKNPQELGQMKINARRSMEQVKGESIVQGIYELL